MILIDSSIWVDHFRQSQSDMERAVSEGIVLHPFVFVELCLGSFRNRVSTTQFLRALPWLLPLKQSDVVGMLERDRLYSTGLNFVDLHLLASARATSGCKLWSRDRRLRAAAERFGVATDLN